MLRPRDMKFTRILLLCFALAVAVAISASAGCSCEPEEDEAVETHEQATAPHEVTDKSLPNSEQFDFRLFNEAVVANSVSGALNKSDEVITSVTLDYQTSADFDEVFDWFEKELGAPATDDRTEAGENTSVWKTSAGGYTTTVTVSTDLTSNNTKVSVTKTKDQ